MAAQALQLEERVGGDLARVQDLAVDEAQGRRVLQITVEVILVVKAIGESLLVLVFGYVGVRQGGQLQVQVTFVEQKHELFEMRDSS